MIIRRLSILALEALLMETLGFIEGATIRIVSVLFGSYIVRIKESKIGINQAFAKMIIVQA